MKIKTILTSVWLLPNVWRLPSVWLLMSAGLFAFVITADGEAIIIKNQHIESQINDNGRIDFIKYDKVNRIGELAWHINYMLNGKENRAGLYHNCQGGPAGPINLSVIKKTHPLSSSMVKTVLMTKNKSIEVKSIVRTIENTVIWNFSLRNTSDKDIGGIRFSLWGVLPDCDYQRFDDRLNMMMSHTIKDNMFVGLSSPRFIRYHSLGAPYPTYNFFLLGVGRKDRFCSFYGTGSFAMTFRIPKLGRRKVLRVPVIIGIAKSFVSLRDSASIFSNINFVRRIYLRYPHAFFKLSATKNSRVVAQSKIYRQENNEERKQAANR